MELRDPPIEGARRRDAQRRDIRIEECAEIH
jgi:hypothetical protein